MKGQLCDASAVHPEQENKTKKRRKKKEKHAASKTPVLPTTVFTERQFPFVICC